MPQRVDATAVKDVLGYNWDKKSRLETWIKMADAVIDRVAQYAQDNNIVVSSDVLTLMAANMAAHYYTQMDPLYTSKSSGGRSGSFREQDYSKIAIQMDPTNYLRVILEGVIEVQAYWGGTPIQDQKDAEDRDGARSR
jgi:hypothetical protein